MSKSVCRWLFTSTMVLIGILLISIPTVHAVAPFRLFILHSYEDGHICGQPQHDGVIDALSKNGFNVGKELELGVYYMDTKRKNNTPELIADQARRAMKAIQAFAPDVLVTLDDNAFKHVALQFVDRGPAVVFSGLNGQPEDYHRQTAFMQSRERPGHNVTGVYEKLHIADAFRIHAKMFDGLEKVVIMVDTSPTGQAIYRQIELELAGEVLPCRWELKSIPSWEAFKAEVDACNHDEAVGAIYPACLLLKDSDGTTYTAGDIFAWTLSNSQKPEIALNFSFTRLGLFGGAAVDFFSMGQHAGEQVAEILRGVPAGNLAIREADRYALSFNLTRAHQLGITLPEEILLAADEVIR